MIELLGKNSPKSITILMLVFGKPARFYSSIQIILSLWTGTAWWCAQSCKSGTVLQLDQQHEGNTTDGSSAPEVLTERFQFGGPKSTTQDREIDLKALDGRPFLASRSSSWNSSKPWHPQWLFPLLVEGKTKSRWCQTIARKLRISRGGIHRQRNYHDRLL